MPTFRRVEFRSCGQQHERVTGRRVGDNAKIRRLRIGGCRWLWLLPLFMSNPSLTPPGNNAVPELRQCPRCGRGCLKLSARSVKCGKCGRVVFSLCPVNPRKNLHYAFSLGKGMWSCSECRADFTAVPCPGCPCVAVPDSRGLCRCEGPKRHAFRIRERLCRYCKVGVMVSEKVALEWVCSACDRSEPISG